MERKITATDAHIHFGEVMRQVAEEGGSVVVEQGGQPQVVVMSVDAYERMKAAQQQIGWQETLARAIQVGARVRVRRGGQPLTPPRSLITHHPTFCPKASSSEQRTQRWVSFLAFGPPQPNLHS